jgi:hypothetical protein
VPYSAKFIQKKGGSIHFYPFFISAFHPPSTWNVPDSAKFIQNWVTQSTCIHFSSPLFIHCRPGMCQIWRNSFKTGLFDPLLPTFHLRCSSTVDLESARFGQIHPKVGCSIHFYPFFISAFHPLSTWNVPDSAKFIQNWVTQSTFIQFHLRF